ncbi:hypothetical protein Cgig2_000921 [Carnegiea gigantea]|uniref:Uncharacterized protein n=1 Tax=Carnegiea gigantea TaxID=171969 RepID=A0A9Q1KNN2_9CARY|nr:hypothetical protein Cgig2_000921 [Carnegiea gigantea]
MPTPRLDVRIGNPFLDPNQVPVLNQDAGLQASHARDTSGVGGVNTAFWNTFGSFMPYNTNLIMSALGSMQQSTLHPIPHPAVAPTPQRTPEPHAQATSQQSGGRILPWSEHEVAVRDKSLIEPEGDTYMLYYHFTKYEMLVAVSLQREPTVDELYKNTHMRRKKESELRLEEHMKRWQEYRSSHSSIDDSSQNPPLSERDIWGHVYGFGAEGVVMKQRSRLSVSTHSFSVHNYDAREMAMRLNESAVKAVEEARQAAEARQKEIEDLRKAIEEKEVKFQHELAQEKAARQRDKEKVKSKISKLWKFFKSQQAGPSTAPPEDDDEDEPDPSHLGDSSDD